MNPTERPTPETDAVWADKKRNILEHARNLARALDGDREGHELRHPLQLPRQLPPPVERRHFSLVPTAAPEVELGVHDFRRQAAIRDKCAVVGMDFRARDGAALFADRLKGMPVLRALAVRDLLVNAPHFVRVAQDHVDGGVELPAAVNIAHPVALDLYAEVVEDLPKLAHVMLRHVALRAARGGRVAERAAEVLAKVLVLALGDFVHRIVVIHAEDVARRDALLAQRAEDGIVDQHPAQRAHMHAARGGLRVIDDLRAVAFCGDFFGPKHRAGRDSGTQGEVEEFAPARFQFSPPALPRNVPLPFFKAPPARTDYLYFSKMITWLIKKVIGSKNTRMVKALRPTVEKINALELEYQKLSDDQLRAKTAAWKERLAKIDDPTEQQCVLNEILPEAFAAVKNAARRMVGSTFTVCDQPYTWNMVHFDVQLIGGICLHRGMIAEMATGEGKTLVATLPLFLNALTGRGAHLVTTNDYLARRDGETMGQLYGFLGLKTGIIQHDQYPNERREQYYHDITYGMNSEFGFDYLRDNGMATSKEQQVQCGYHYAIVDEVDSILIDEARTPLIISGPATVSTHQYDTFKPLVDQLVKKQTMLCNRLVSEAEALWEEKKTDDYGRTMFKVKLGQPRNKGYLRAMEDTDKRKVIEKVELSFFGDTRKEELFGLKEELFFVMDERAHEADLSEQGRTFMNPSDPDTFVLPDLITQFAEIDQNAVWRFDCLDFRHLGSRCRLFDAPLAISDTRATSFRARRARFYSHGVWAFRVAWLFPWPAKCGFWFGGGVHAVRFIGFICSE